MVKRIGLSMLIIMLYFGFGLNGRFALGEEASSKEAFKSQFDKAMLTVYNAKTPEDLEKAASEFIVARTINPSNPQVHFNLGLIYLELDEFTRAVDSFETYLSLLPASNDAARARNLLTRARKLQKQLDEAKIAMLNPRAWHFVGKKPVELNTPWFSTEFRQTKGGELQVKNPRFNFSPLGEEALTRRNPWLPVDFKGRYLKYIVCLMRQHLCERKPYPAGYSYSLIQGEIVLKEDRTLVIGRHYAYDVFLRKATDEGASNMVVYELRP